MIFLKFNTIGIICEYNPFHFGHKYHIQETIKLYGCENIVCIMSGSMVQRGECAILSKWLRAKSAIDAGADLVIELPAYYVLQSADIFARGAVDILDKLGIIDAISFGSECGNINDLIKAASIMESDEFNSIIKRNLDSGLSYPAASQKALTECMPGASEDFFKPNNTLGICYIKALQNLNSDITPLCIKRDNDYHGQASNDGYMSASEIRRMMRNSENYEMYADLYEAGELYDLKNAESYILGVLRNTSREKLKTIKGYEDGLGDLILNSAKKACSIDELFDMCTSKRYTLHRIKRYVMSILLDICYDSAPGYIRILGIGKNGGKLINRIKGNSSLDIITKLADYKKENAMLKTDINATDFCSLCANSTELRYSGKDYTTSPYIKKASL